ncbi:hypothetical protein Dimus_005453, partial [Dionaea muscipula]
TESVNTSKKYWRNQNTQSHSRLQEVVANDETITIAVRVKSSEMKPFQRFIHFLVMKNVIPRFWKERHFKLHGSDIYGSSNDKEVSQSATSDDETHELCDLYEGS